MATDRENQLVLSSRVMTINSSPDHKLRAGSGRIVLSVHGKRAIFSELSSTYPLKLLSPHVQGETAIVYLLSYGGGLVSGDEVDLHVDIEVGGRLILLSQGSTKVFKSRPGRRLASVKSDIIQSLSLQGDSTAAAVPSSRQNLNFHLAPKSTLFLIPEPVTCFRDASYNQAQRFYLQEDASVVILDWITSGRMSVGEEWVFSHYHSLNEIFLGGKRVAKDVMLLDNEELGIPIPRRPLRERLRPYSCYAMLILYGPQIQSVIADITAKYNDISVFKTRKPEPLIWSLSPMDSANKGVVVRVAGLETEMVKEWLKEALLGVEAIVGRDLYRRVFP